MGKMYKIGIIKGDGIGPEIIDEAVNVLDAVSTKFGFELNYEEFLLGGAAIDETGVPLPEETIAGVKRVDAVLFGAIGGPKWDNLERHLRPESGLLGLRKEMGTFANIYFGQPREYSENKAYNTMVYSKDELSILQ